MSPDQVQLLRRLALNDREAINDVMGGSWDDGSSLEPRTEALVRIITLLGIDSDPGTLRWAVDLGMVAGLEDDDIFSALLVISPIIGVARLTSALPRLMAALDLEVVDG